MKKKIGAFGAGQFSLGTLACGRPGTTIFQNPGGGGGGAGGCRIQGPGPAGPPCFKQKEKNEIFFGHTCLTFSSFFFTPVWLGNGTGRGLVKIVGPQRPKKNCNKLRFLGAMCNMSNFFWRTRM